MDMSQYLGAFLDETDDNVQRLDDYLLALEKNMVDMDVINEIFRAAHTLKGMAGTMGFTNIMGLTHAMEDRLDAARKGTRPLTESDMNLLFKGLDTLQEMADAIRGGGNDANIDVSDMVHAFRNEGPMPEAAAAPAASAAPAAQPAEGGAGASSEDADWVKHANEEGQSAYEVHVILSQSCLLKAARAYMVVNRLEELGEIYKAIPSTDALEKEEFDFDFKIFVSSTASAEDVKTTLEKIGDVQTAEVKELKAEEMAAAAPATAPAPAAQAEAPAAPKVEAPAAPKAETPKAEAPVKE